MAIYNKIETTEVEGEEKKDALILIVTNGHKEAIDKIVKAYNIKDGDPAKLLAFFISVASEESVIGETSWNNWQLFFIAERMGGTEPE